MRVLRGVSDSYFFRTGSGPYGRSGISDILGCCRGQWVSFEVKVPGGKETDNQYRFRKNIESAGGRAYIVESIDQVLEAIKEFDAHD